MNAFVLRAYCGYIFLQNTLKRKNVTVTSCSATKSKREKIYSSDSDSDSAENNGEQKIHEIALILCRNFYPLLFLLKVIIHPFDRMKKLDKYLYPVDLRKRLIILKINK